ncbi:MAG: peroxiredoxin family protein [Planctomycetaceae bacterium]|jgi:peroxiredoxin Q/BCP
MTRWMLLMGAWLGLAIGMGVGLQAVADDKVAAENAKAPDFKLKASDGKEYALKDLVGKQAVVIAWFPKAFTGGCRLECLSMREAGEQIRKYNVAYFTASCDDLETQMKWAKELQLDYPVLSDPEKSIAKAYGVVHEGREVPERWTFVIDKEGVIRHIDKKVQTKTHGEDIVKLLEQLGVEKRK